MTEMGRQVPWATINVNDNIYPWRYIAGGAFSTVTEYTITHTFVTGNFYKLILLLNSISADGEIRMIVNGNSSNTNVRKMLRIYTSSGIGYATATGNVYLADFDYSGGGLGGDVDMMVCENYVTPVKNNLMSYNNVNYEHCQPTENLYAIINEQINSLTLMQSAGGTFSGKAALMRMEMPS